MASNKPTLGVLGSGMASKAAKDLKKNTKKKKSRLDELMRGLKQGRKAQ